MEHVERLYAFVAGDGAMEHATRNAPHLAGLKRPCLATDRERQLAFEQHSHLLMRMAVRLHHGSGLEFYEREHHLVAGRRENVDSGEDLVVRCVGTRNEV